MWRIVTVEPDGTRWTRTGSQPESTARELARKWNARAKREGDDIRYIVQREV